jgi:signal transduction histidine kinase
MHCVSLLGGVFSGLMLLDFIAANREELIARTRAKVARRMAPRPTERELTTGVPLFLEQLAQTLRRGTAAEATSDAGSRQSAAMHGALLLGRGYTIAQVVHDYGDICQAITELAAETDAPITTDEFHTLNLSLDNAIAEAVTEYSRLRDRSMVQGETERSGVFAHELRNKINAAQLAHLAIKGGRAPTNGGVAAVLTRSLQGMTELINRSLVEVRLDSGTMQRQRVSVSEIVDEAGVGGLLEASARGVSLTIIPTDREIDVYVDPQILAGAIANLLQNAFKFTRVGGHVSLRTTTSADRVAIAIEDECGGLPAGKEKELFGAFQQIGSNRAGLGLGLFISRKGVEASGGVIHVRDVPGHGCVFTIDLPVMPVNS